MSDQKTVEDQVVILDYNRYENTVFRRCKIVYRGGGVPILHNNTFESCEWIFENEALNTVMFLSAIARSTPSGKEFVVTGILGLK
jgi:hypothetical protein